MPSSDRAVRFTVRGLDCGEEVAALKSTVGPLVGGEENLAFDLLNARLTVHSPDGKPVEVDAVLAAVVRAGLHAEVWTAGAPEEGDGWARHGRLFLTCLSGALVAAGFGLHALQEGSLTLAFTGADGQGLPVLAIACYLGAVVVGGWFVAPKAWAALRRLQPDMNLLMTFAVVGAIGIGEWFEAAAVVFLFSLSLTLESWSVGRARRAVQRLLELAPDLARRLGPGGEEEEVAPGDVSVGERVLVKPGERIPIDGSVVAGSSAVDQAPVTGESVPALKEPGAQVFAGTINGDGALEVVCDKPASDTTLACIIRLVGEAHAKRAPSEQWVERFARIYTPAVLGVAVAVAVLPPLLVGAAWGAWFYRALVLLVIACPCALVIATPVSIVAALAASARHGVLVKGGVHMETPARLDAMAFDKTGTLTQGRPVVVELVPLNGHDERELLARAAALEARSEHTLARAIVARAKEDGVAFEPAEDFQAVKGKGASGQVEGRLFWLGSHRYLEERGQEVGELHARLDSMSAAGRTVVVVGNDDHVCGLIAMADAVRPNAKRILAELRKAGVSRLVMLTGDNEGTARAIAAELGIDDVRAGLLPEDKVAAIAELAAQGTVAMVGDGVNDAPAMARASLAIAMGAGGTDAAIETADVALMSDDLSRLPWLVRHSRRTLRVIRQNIASALGVKAIFVVATFAGYASLWAAIAADTGVSLVVIFNALRLLDPKDPPVQ
ncbi:MAG: heavy metal translocating P-type ATPase [Planctomycetota bacterium]